MSSALSAADACVYAAEFLVNSAALAANLLFLYILWDAKLFLFNQKVYIANVVAANLLDIVFRQPLLIQIICECTLFGEPIYSYMNSIHELSVNVALNMLAQLVMFVDVFMTIADNAEPHRYSAFFWVGMQWLLAKGNMVLGRHDFPPPAYTMVILEFLNVVCWFAFFGLVVLGRFRYRTNAVGDVKQKYLISVNIRTLGVIKVLALCSALRNLVCINELILVYVYIRPRELLYLVRYGEFAYDMSLALYCLVVPYVMVTSHVEMKRTLIRLLKRRPASALSVRTEAWTSAALAPRNAIGDVLRPAGNEHDLHFSVLHNDWGTLGVPKKS